MFEASKSGEAAVSPSVSTPSSGRSSPIALEMETIQAKPVQRGKAPPVDPFTEDPAVKLEDWMPVLEGITLEWMVAGGRADPACRPLERPCSPRVGSVEHH